MTRARGLGGGHVGEFLNISMRPDATFITEITALIAAGTAVEGKLISGTTAANYECTSVAADGDPWGQIITYEKDADYTYLLTVELWLYADVEGSLHSAHCIRNLPDNAGTIALGQEIQINGSDYMYIDGVNTGGSGYVIGVDVPTTSWCDVLF